MKHLGYEVKMAKVTNELFKVEVDGAEFCRVAKFDGEWVAYNEMTDRSGATKGEAVKALMEVLY